jgi:hypothetical protein
VSSRQIVDAEPGEPFTGAKPPGTEDVAPQSTALTAPKPAGPKLGFWLDEPDETKVAKDIVRKWKAQDKAAKSRRARWECNELRRMGDQFSKVKYNADTGEYSLYVPIGSENAPPSLNKTDALCTKMVANLLVDPPRPDAEPPSDSDEDRAASEFTTRALLDLHSESGLAMDETLREAEEIACTHGSGFVRYWVDPNGGGQRPKEIMAGFDPATGEMAQGEADALLRMVAPPPVPPVVDPLTAAPGGDPSTAPVAAPAVVPPLEPQPTPWPDYKIRYVMPGGQLTDNASEAEIVWLPKVRREVLTGKHVRFLPDTASSIKDAEGVLLCGAVSIGSLKRLFAERVAAMSPDDLKALTGHKPERYKDLLPKHVAQRYGQEESRTDGAEGPPDDALAFVYTAYLSACPEYPKGAHVVIGGDRFVLSKAPLSAEIEDGEGGVRIEHMDIPVAQFRQFMDTTHGDPYGRGLVDKIGDGDPILALALGYLIEYVYNANNPHLFVPIGSGIHEKSMQAPRGTPIPYNGAQGAPVFQPVPPFASETMNLYDRVESYMNDRSGLNETAQGESSPNVTSGRQARIEVEQALVALSGAASAMKEGFVRSCRIQCQLMKAHYTTPQKVRVPGEDGAFKVKEWTRADLGSTTDVKIAAGTGTMLSPSAKAAVASEQLEIAMQRQDQRGIDMYYKALTGNVHPVLGMQDDPAEMEVKRSISAWSEGPPDGWAPLPPMPVADPMTGAPAVDPMTGQPAMQPQVDPVVSGIFLPKPNHEDPTVALVRYRELSRAMSGTKYAKQPPEWRAVLDAEFEKARRAAGVATIAEQQAAQAQMQQQQMQMDADAKAEAGLESDKERAFRGAESDKDREVQREKQAMEAEMANRQPGSKAA